MQTENEKQAYSLTRYWVVLMVILLIPATVQAADTAEEVVEQVVVPEVYRRDVKAPKIEGQNIDVSVFLGYLSIEDFGSNPVGGIRLTYNITENIFMQAAYAVSEVEDSSFRNFGLNVFAEETESLSYYELSAGYRLLPGELFRGKRYAMPGSVYLKGGVGSTTFAGEDHFTATLGFGMNVLVRHNLSLGVEMQDHLFENDILGDNSVTNNLEFSLSAGIYF